MRSERITGAFFLLAVAACVGTTGSDFVDVPMAAVGTPEAKDFTSGRGYHVVLTRARVRVGAVYLNQSVPTSGSQATSCVQPGIYVAEVTQGLVVDALSGDRQPFPVAAHATADRARAAEVWLTGTSDVDALDDPTVILDVAGTAERGGATYPFEAALTIGKNRAIPPHDPAQPGANPICKQRIVTPIAVDLVPRAGATLLLRVDPRGFFGNVDFAELPAEPATALRRFADQPADPASNNLYNGLRAVGGTYRVELVNP